MVGSSGQIIAVMWNECQKAFQAEIDVDMFRIPQENGTAATMGLLKTCKTPRKNNLFWQHCLKTKGKSFILLPSPTICWTVVLNHLLPVAGIGLLSVKEKIMIWSRTGTTLSYLGIGQAALLCLILVQPLSPKHCQGAGYVSAMFHWGKMGWLSQSLPITPWSWQVLSMS